MKDRINRHLEEMGKQGESDRRNGSFPRHLLTELGDIELKVPRSRRISGVEIVRTYARQAGQIDRMILSCFVLGLSTFGVINLQNSPGVDAGIRRAYKHNGGKPADQEFR